MTVPLLGTSTEVNEYPVLSMPSILPLSPSTRNALPSGKAKKAMSLTQTQCGVGRAGSFSTTPSESAGSCAQPPGAQTQAARASAALVRARRRPITLRRLAMSCSETLREFDTDGARLVEEQPRPPWDFGR